MTPPLSVLCCPSLTFQDISSLFWCLLPHQMISCLAAVTQPAEGGLCHFLNSVSICQVAFLCQVLGVERKSKFSCYLLFMVRVLDHQHQQTVWELITLTDAWVPPCMLGGLQWKYKKHWILEVSVSKVRRDVNASASFWVHAGITNQSGSLSQSPCLSLQTFLSTVFQVMARDQGSSLCQPLPSASWSL